MKPALSHPVIPRSLARTLTVALFLFPSCSSREKWWDGPGIEQATPLARTIVEISSGNGSRDRGIAIINRLQSLGIVYRIQHFGGLLGENILAALPQGGSRRILIAAHYDRVEVGQGAVDNAAGCAVVLELLERLKRTPLKKSSLVAAFFDQEERELAGSAAFVEMSHRDGVRREERLPDLCLVFDVFAYGDTLWAYGPRKGSSLNVAIEESTRSSGFPLRESVSYPPGDHLSFLDAGIETAAISLLPRDEIDGVTKALLGRPQVITPRILRLIHTKRDQLSEVDLHAVERAIPVIERIIRILDA